MCSSVAAAGRSEVVALERLDKLPAGRWARLLEDVRRCQLRRGAWYPVLSLGPDEAVLVVRHQSMIVPPAYLEIVRTRPSRWTVVPRERYAACPNCAERVALGTRPGRMRCGRCSEVFEFELEHEYSAPHAPCRVEPRVERGLGSPLLELADVPDEPEGGVDDALIGDEIAGFGRLRRLVVARHELPQHRRRAFSLVWKLHVECPLAGQREPRTLSRVLAVADRRRRQHRLPQGFLTNAHLYVIGDPPNLMELPLHPCRVNPASDWLHICNLLSDERMARVALSAGSQI